MNVWCQHEFSKSKFKVFLFHAVTEALGIDETVLSPHQLITVHYIQFMKHLDSSCHTCSFTDFWPELMSFITDLNNVVLVAVTTTYPLLWNAFGFSHDRLPGKVLVLSSNNITYHCYADDTRPNLSFPSGGYTAWGVHLWITSLSGCMPTTPGSALTRVNCSSFKAFPALIKILPSSLMTLRWPLLPVNNFTAIPDNQVSFIKHWPSQLRLTPYFFTPDSSHLPAFCLDNYYETPFGLGFKSEAPI